MVAVVALVPGARARPTPESGELESRMFQGSSLCLMALEVQLRSLETQLRSLETLLSSQLWGFSRRSPGAVAMV